MASFSDLRPPSGLTLGLKQFRSDGGYSYLFHDKSTKKALLIDPDVMNHDEVREFLGEHGIELLMTVDTHCHADHFSATHLFPAAQIAMSEKTRSERPTRKLKDGEWLEIGSLKLRVMHTPGHTRDGICLYGEGILFSGDTLLIGSTGRVDFGEASSEALWESLQKLKSLPDETLVYPAHDYADRLFSTIQTEKKKNADFACADRDVFIERKRDECLEVAPKEVKQRLEFNLSRNPSLQRVAESLKSERQCASNAEDDTVIGSISTEKFLHKLEKGGKRIRFIDVREPEEYKAGHMPGMKNIPLSEVGLRLDELRDSERIFVSCLSGRRSSYVARTLGYLGFPDVVNVEGGFKAWTNSGYLVETSLEANEEESPS